VHHILVVRGCAKTVVSPEFAAYGGTCIGERWPDLRIPRSFADVLRGAIWEPVLCEQRHQGEQPEQGWGGATDRRISPLPLRLQTEVAMCFREGDFALPAQEEPGPDLLGRLVKVGTQERLGGELVL